MFSQLQFEVWDAIQSESSFFNAVLGCALVLVGKAWDLWRGLENQTMYLYHPEYEQCILHGQSHYARLRLARFKLEARKATKHLCCAPSLFEDDDYNAMILSREIEKPYKISLGNIDKRFHFHIFDLTYADGLLEVLLHCFMLSYSKSLIRELDSDAPCLFAKLTPEGDV